MPAGMTEKCEGAGPGKVLLAEEPGMNEEPIVSSTGRGVSNAARPVGRH